MKRIRAFLRVSALLAFHVAVVRPLLRWFWGVKYRRLGRVPKGPCLVIANHNSHLDAAVLMSLFPLSRLPHVHPVAAADYFGKTWFRRALAMVLMNGIPIDRTAGPGRDVLQPMIEALKRGETLIFFPEGSRGEAGVVAPFRPGVGRLVQKVPGLLVVPVFLSGPERIWPRGEAIPLPLGIDVHVGKPRVYPPDGESREIAEAIRTDVLALAPPPAPMPGPRPLPPIRIAVCGISAESVGEVFEALLPRLGKVDRTVGIADPVLQADESGIRELPGQVPLARSRLWPSVLAWMFRTGRLWRGSKFAEMVERARIDEALGDGRMARFVIGRGSPLVDLLAWAEADFYSGAFDEKGMQQLMLVLSGRRRISWRQFPRFARKAPEVFLLSVFDLARPPAPDVLVLVDEDPVRAVERRRASGEAFESWSNEAFLGVLRDAYRSVAEVFRRSRVEVLAFDPASASVAEIAEAAERACRRRSAVEPSAAAHS